MYKVKTDGTVCIKKKKPIFISIMFQGRAVIDVRKTCNIIK